MLGVSIGSVLAEPSIDLKRLKESYPGVITDVSPQYITWHDGTKMRLMGSSLFDKISRWFHPELAKSSISIKDLQCHNYELFLKKMYGDSVGQVKQKLVIVYWMPKVFGKRYPLKVTTVNGIDKKIRAISAELERLPPENFKYLANPAGSFYWRKVKSEKYLSAHSFGIALDINSHYGNYWLWDWEKAHKPAQQLTLHNNIPLKIVHIFEQQGFVWGGRWYYYDTMHFEYRPELFIKEAHALRYNDALSLYCYA